MQMMWGVIPQLAEAQWALRRGAWLRRWLALLVVLSERVAIMTASTLLSRVYPRADHVLWASAWPRMVFVWTLFGAELALIGVLTWAQARANAVTLELPQDPSDQRMAANAPSEQSASAKQVLGFRLPQVRPARRSAVAPLPSETLAGNSKEALRSGNGQDAHSG